MLDTKTVLGRAARRTDRQRVLRRWVVAFAVAVTVLGGLVIVRGFDGEGPATTAASRTLQRIGDDSKPPGAGGSAATTTKVKKTKLPRGTLHLLPAPPPTPVILPGGPLAPVVSRVPTTNKVIFLGIDDGLIRDPAVLTLLKQAGIPFTMFLVEGAAAAGEDYWKAAELLGGTVEDHTVTHPQLTRVSPARQYREICGPLDELQARFGRRPTLFRPPYGVYNTSVRQVVASCGLKAVVMWTGSTNDGRLDLQSGNPALQPGDILLMHWRTDLAQNLLTVFDRIRAQGFAIGRLEDYLSPDPPPTRTTRPNP